MKSTVVAVTLLLSMTSTAMALPPARTNPISKASELFCKSVENKNYEMMDTMLAQGADVNATCSFGYNGGWGKMTPLLAAVKDRGMLSYADKGDIFAYLLDHGADVNARTQDGTTPLMMAVDIFRNNWEGSADLVRLFVSKGAKVDAVDKFGYTAFEYQAAQGYTPHTIEFWKQNFSLLLGQGVDINRQGKSGESTLIRAAKSCGSTNVEMLLASGANPDLKDKNGQTAYDIALESAANSRQPGCNNTVRILANPQLYMKGRIAAKAPVANANSQQPSKQSPNIFDALNSLSKALDQTAR